MASPENDTAHAPRRVGVTMATPGSWAAMFQPEAPCIHCEALCNRVTHSPDVRTGLYQEEGLIRQ